MGRILDAECTSANKVHVVPALRVGEADKNQTRHYVDNCNGEQCDKGLALGAESV